MKKTSLKRILIFLLIVVMMVPSAVWAETDQNGEQNAGVEEAADSEKASEETVAEGDDEQSPEVFGDSGDAAIPEIKEEPEMPAEPAKEPEVISEKIEAVEEAQELNPGQARIKSGWQESDGKLWYQNEDGSWPANQWMKIGKYTFRFDKDGYLMTGWQMIDGNTYFLKRTGVPGVKGARLLGWQTINNKTYYFKKSGAKAGAMFAGLQSIGEKRYYFTPGGENGVRGSLVTGWAKPNKYTYYFKKTGEKGIKGVSLRGWQNIGSNTYYFKKTGTYAGAVLTGFQKLGNRTFYFMRSEAHKGKMLTGWQSIGGNRYYFKKSGSKGTKGAMLTGWQSIGGKQYYFEQNGVYVPGKKRIKVAIDAGHQRKGNSEKEPIGPGASEYKAKVSSGTYGKWSKLNEYELNLTVAKKLQTELKKRGYDVYMIRTTHDVNISNSERAKMAAKAGSDILVRIHANGDDNSGVYGALTMAPGNGNRFLTKANRQASQKLSQKIIDSFCKATSAKNRGVLYVDNMSGINWSTIPVTIVEMGFMSNPTEDAKMATDAYQNKMVQGMANGIDQYFS